jgi:hypothetical protein
MGVCAYSADALAFAIIISGLGIPLTWDLFLQATFISGVAAALGALSGVPNGAGVTEISNTGMLVAIVGAQHPDFTLAGAATAALLQGFFHKWLRVLVGLCVGFLFRKRLFPDTLDEAVAELEAKRPGRAVQKAESQAIVLRLPFPPRSRPTDVPPGGVIAVFDDHRHIGLSAV